MRTVADVVEDPRSGGDVVPLDELRLLRDLRDILRSAVELQSPAAQVIDACMEPGGKTAELARLGGSVTSGYFQLRERLRGFPPSPLVDEIAALLNYHQQMVEQALLFGYRGFEEGRERILRGWSGRLGHPAKRLRELYAQVRRQLAEPRATPTPKSRS
ncbi:MAG: hypothetical protein K6T28_06515 [Acidothermus sp.]|nr:hypothetical protein [Acidothermus sp.]